MEPTPAQRDQFFHKIKSKRANQSCFDCGASSPTWTSIPLSIYLCLECSGHHRNLGVHISFVRSTVLDIWTWEQLRSMKVGGNLAASEFFKQHGGIVGQTGDINAKYSSRVAQLWKDKVKQLADEDRLTYPNMVVLEDVSDGVTPNSSNSNKTDFFTSMSSASSTNSTKLVTLQANPFAINPSTSNPTSTPNHSNSGSVTSSPFTSSIPRPLGVGLGGTSRPVKSKGLGAMAAPIDFAEAEAKARAAEEARKTQITITPMAMASTTILTSTSPPGSVSRNTSPTSSITNNSNSGHSTHMTPKTTPSTSDTTTLQTTTGGVGGGVGPMSDRLGMGFGKLSLNANQSTSTTSSSPKSIPKYSPEASSGPSGDAQQRFTGAKSISSDMYFSRNAHTPMSDEERSRLNQFQGAQSISSAAYFGQPDQVQSSTSSLSRGFGGLGSGPDLSSLSAKEFARNFASQAAQDLTALKSFASTAASKLQSALNDAQQRSPGGGY